MLKAAQFLVIRRHAVGLIMLSLLIAASTTGAGWAHHFVLMIGYAIVVGRCLLARAPLEQPEPRLRPFTRRRSAGLGAPQRARSSPLPLLSDPRWRSLT